jgi:hypothetical protein
MPGGGSAFMAWTFNRIPPSVNAQKQGPGIAGVAAAGDNGETGASAKAPDFLRF